eukprot:TRINITY_DN26945_c0_g1_i1.p1 TRINITY_DN26945_c0_g1~~TRINITY_DN26945_c0_g1_i1.p1  ORF type:complete len:454 (-),score=53.64 TRINITY_DN26945_c0_g1_i1:81-1442(-)
MTAALVQELKGWFIKIGQMASTRDDFIPPQYMELFKLLQDKAPVEWDERSVLFALQNYLGRPVDEVFSEFDVHPIGSGTIGQVHKARLRSDNSLVAVKLQYPRAEEWFQADLGLILNFLKLAMPQHVPYVMELHNQFRSEFDYLFEAELMQHVHDSMARAFPKEVRVPRPVRHLCSKTLLVMELLEGERLVDAIRRQYSMIAVRLGKTLTELEQEQKLRKSRGLEWGLVGYHMISKLNIAPKNFVILVYNLFATATARPRKEYVHCELPLNLPRILRLLAEVHGYQVLIDGIFNADPHPGNVLLLPDGRLGLLDYGQVGQLSTTARLQFANLIQALTTQNKDNVCTAISNMGYKFKKNDEDLIWRYATFHFDRDDLQVTNGMNPLTFMEWLDHSNPLLAMPADYVLIGRMILVLRGFSTAFGLPFSAAQYWANYAKQALIHQRLFYFFFSNYV